MSRPRLVLTPAAMALTASMLMAGSVQGQSVQELRERLQILEGMLDDVRPAAADTLPPEELDTVVSGSLTLVARPRNISFARDVARDAWEIITARLQSDTTLLPPLRFYAQPPDDSMRPPWDQLNKLDLARRQPLGHSMVQGRRESPLAGAVEDLIVNVERTLHTRVWGTGTWEFEVQVDTLNESGWRSMYLTLALGRSEFVRRCAVDAGACRAVLELDGHAVEPEEWLTATERRRFVQEFYGERTDAETRACIDTESDSACLAVLRRSNWPPYFRPPPHVRGSLFSLAVNLGGDGAWSRVASSPDLAPGERLSLAAQVPVDSLVELWHARVIQSRPAPAVITRLTGWTAFGWAVLFAIAAARGSRWH